MELKIGDVVKLKSGSFKMTIIHITDDNIYLCSWEQCNENGFKSLGRAYFPFEALLKVEE